MAKLTEHRLGWRSLFKGLLSIVVAVAVTATSTAEAQLLPRRVATLFNAVAVSSPARLTGLTATAFADTPTLQYHINTAAITTLGGNATITASVNNTTMTVAAVTGSPLAVGMVIQGGAAPGMQRYRRIVAFGTGTGGPGTYTLSADALSINIASSTMTATGDATVLSVAERNGGAPLTSVAATAPLLMTEFADGSEALGAQPGGRLFLRYASINGGSLQSGKSIITTTGIDAYNITMFAALRSHNSKGGTFANLGTGANRAILSVGLGTSGSTNGGIAVPYVKGQGNTFPLASPPANRSQLLVGASLSVIGTSAATADGVGGGGGSVTTIDYHNETSASSSTPLLTRVVNGTDIIIGQNNLGSNALAMDMYELDVWKNGEFTVGNYASKSAAARNALTANYSIVPFTRRIIIYGDSRSEESFAGGLNMALYAARAVPPGTQVISQAYSGGTTLQIWQAMADPLSIYASASRLSSTDRVVWFEGWNEIFNSGAIWPTNVSAANTAARADETFNGGGNLAVNDFTGTVTISGTTVTIQSVTSGYALLGMVLTIPGVDAGARIASGTATNLPTGTNTVGATFSLPTAKSYSIGSPVSVTGTWPNVVRVVNGLLAAGFEIRIGTNAGPNGTANDAFNAHLVSDLLAAVSAGAGQAYDGKVGVVDFRQITDNGYKPFGNDFNSQATTYLRDTSTHPNDYGRSVLWSGGSTPEYGYRTLLF